MDATCETPKTCSTCNEVEGEALGHTWVEATCEAPKTCSACGLTEGEALEHVFSEASYANAPTCELCGFVDGKSDRDKIVFSTDRQYTLPYAFEFVDDTFLNIKEYPEYSLDKLDGSRITITDIGISDDGDGYQTIAISCDTSSETKFLADITKGDGGKFYFSYTVPNLGFFDYYSGCVLPDEDIPNDGERKFSVELPQDDSNIDVEMTVSSESESYFDDWEWTSDTEANQIYHSSFYRSYFIRVPKEYDGLCIYVYKKGVSEVDFESNTLNGETDEDNGAYSQSYSASDLERLFDAHEDGTQYSPDDYYFIKISDLVSE